MSPEKIYFPSFIFKQTLQNKNVRLSPQMTIPCLCCKIMLLISPIVFIKIKVRSL